MFNSGSTSGARAEVRQGVNLPDYFSCRNCRAHGSSMDLCRELREARVCAKQALIFALQSGQVQIHLVIDQRALPGR